MTNRLEINWKIDGFIDEQRYYRSEISIDPENLPPPSAVLMGDVRTHVDTNIEAGKTYYVCVSSVKNLIEKISKPVSVDTVAALNELLIFADAETYPSTTFTDSSPKARVVTAKGGIKKVLVDGDGWIHFDNTGNTATSNKFLETTLQSALLLDDFTVEFFVKPEYSKATQYGRLFAIGTHSTNGMISVSKSENPWTLNIDIFDNGWGGGVKVPIPPVLQNEQVTHICLMRKLGLFYIFINGILAASKSDAITYSLSQTNIYIGTHPYNNNTAFDSFGGHMSSIRLTRFARYSEAGFTPPNYKFPR